MRPSRWCFGSFVCLSLYFFMPALQAEVPKDTLVQAWQIDDLITLDPAEVFEFSGAEYAANVYDRLVTYPPDDVSNLQQQGWNDTVSSLRVRLDFARVTRPEAEAIVLRAYQAVLGRDPDPAAQGWVERVMRDRWTQRDVERELRRSAEFRNRRPPQD